MLQYVLSKFARPNIIAVPEHKIEWFDDRLAKTEAKQINIETRMRLLGIQSTPRGSIDD